MSPTELVLVPSNSVMRVPTRREAEALVRLWASRRPGGVSHHPGLGTGVRHDLDELVDRLVSGQLVLVRHSSDPQLDPVEPGDAALLLG